uniref:AlNc14C334G10722 protein n=1 Tax=Albugo laibachii Nc14 TaxID=890382 RepID=F0WWW1_9STRA|nr:AlNc14C334G10722 [Albugo laibachii Nc14]|eukprot:CCA25946.1 AlNc14C334G10722 [Albugo laibachii Nc14]
MNSKTAKPPIQNSPAIINSRVECHTIFRCDFVIVTGEGRRKSDLVALYAHHMQYPAQ